MGGSADSGWVLLSAGIIDSPIFRGPADMFRLWVLLLCKAHRRQEPFRLMGGKEIHRGELVTSMADLQGGLLREGTPQAGESGAVSLSRQTIQRYLDAMAKDSMIERKSTRKGTWIKILNFDTYQSFDTYRASRADKDADAKADRQADTSGQEKSQQGSGDETTAGNVYGQACGQAHGQASGHKRTRAANKRTRAATNDSDTPISPNTHTQDACARSDSLEVHSSAVEWTIWGEYVKRYEAHSQGIFPGHSSKGALTTLKNIRRQLDHLRKPTTSPEDYMALACDAMDRFFEMEDQFVVESDYALATFASRLPRILKQLREGT